MKKTYNTKLIFENNQDKQNLLETLQLQLNAYNYISNIIYNNNNFILIKKLVHDKTYSYTRKEFPNLPSQFVIRSYNDVTSNYKSIKSNKQKISKPITKKNLSVRLDKRLYTFKTYNKIRLTTLNKRINTTLHIYPKLLEHLKYKISDPLLYVKNNDIYISLTFEVPSEIYIDNDQSIGLDLGCKRLIASSEGYFIKSSNYLKHKRKIRYLKRKLQSKKNKSSTARKHLKKLSKKEHNFSKNYIHLLVNQVLKTKANTIVIENLSKIKQNTSKQGKRHNNRLSQIPFYRFKEILSYKAQALGKRVVTVNPYNTSKDDYRKLSNGIRKGCRYYSSDKLVFDADIQASINIRNRYKHSDSFMPFDGDYRLIGQDSVNNPIVIFANYL